ncbi:PAS domain S-box protein [Halobellus marinus]|uniref:PAS domain S-box protein n=1 Tax=Halobellus TaxID=1073986 RepID=UPI0028AA4346|nr:PAS domain S-box protein [Halobellus sp. DFY28]
MNSHPSQDIYAETLAVFDQNEQQYEPLTTPEVADVLDAKRRTVYKRLQKLVDRGELETKETGSNSRVWWRPPTPSSTTLPDVSTDRKPRSEGDSPDESTPPEVDTTDRVSSQSEKGLNGSQSYREIFEAIPVGVTLRDASDGTLIDVNQQYCEMLGYSREELLAPDSERAHANVPPYTTAKADQYIRQAETDGPQTFEWLDQTKEGEQLPVEVHLRQTTLDGGDKILAVVRDITDRKERKRKREEANQQLQAVVDTVEAAIFIKDTEGRYQLMNDECKKQLGLDPGKEIVGLTDEDLFPPETAEQYHTDDKRVLEQGETIRVEESIPMSEGVQTHLTLKSPLFDGDGQLAGVCAVSTDITDRKDREQKLQARSTAMESSIDGMAILDANGEYAFVNQAHTDIYGYDDQDAFLGETWQMCYDEDEIGRFETEIMPTLYDQGAWRGEVRGQRKDGTTFPQELSLSVTDDDGIVCVVRDISGRKEREGELRAARRFNEELVENAPFGMFRLDEDLQITYENPRAHEIVGLPEDRDSSPAIGVDIRELPSIVETGKADLFTRLQDGETIEFEFPFESIYGKEAYFTGRGVPLYRGGEFDGGILMATDISDHRQYERELERQQEQLEALNDLHGVVHEITEAVIEQSTREEIERAVCDRLAASESYQFAAFADISLSLSSGDQAGQGPTGEAVRTQEIQIAQNPLEGSDSEPWHQYAEEYGFKSAAAIPIVHGARLYGVISVYSERTDAFATEEREVLGQLGEVIGHTIAALDRKRALMSDEVIELTLQIPQLLESRDVSVTADETVTIKRTIPLGDDEYLMYGTATPDALDMIYAMGEQFPDWKSVRTFGETDGEVRFEQRLSSPPVTSIIADQGGHFEEGRIEDGEYSLTVHLPPGADVRQIIADIREIYPSVESLSQRQITREESSPHQTLSLLTEKLTQRQRAALEAGYHGGFFEWPRDRSGEEVAESLDIGASTFHQHIRKAEKKLLDVVFA